MFSQFLHYAGVKSEGTHVYFFAFDLFDDLATLL